MLLQAVVARVEFRSENGVHFFLTCIRKVFRAFCVRGGDFFLYLAGVSFLTFEYIKWDFFLFLLARNLRCRFTFSRATKQIQNCLPRRVFCLSLLFVWYTLGECVCVLIKPQSPFVFCLWKLQFMFYGICSTVICRIRYIYAHLLVYLYTTHILLLNCRQYLLVRPKSQFNNFVFGIWDNTNGIMKRKS